MNTFSKETKMVSLGVILIALSIAVFIISDSRSKSKHTHDLALSIFTRAEMKAMNTLQMERYERHYSKIFNKKLELDASDALLYAEQFEKDVNAGKDLHVAKKIEHLATTMQPGLPFIINQDSIDNVKSCEIKKLKSKFVIKHDDFNNTETYYHKTFGWKYFPNRKTLYCYFRASGNIFLVSNYYSDDWLFHDCVNVLINGTTYYSELVESYKDNNVHDNDGGKIWENITYTLSEDIIQAIAENYTSTIKVRFKGNKFYDDVTLSSKDKLAIKESYDLYTLLR